MCKIKKIYIIPEMKKNVKKVNNCNKKKFNLYSSQINISYFICVDVFFSHLNVVL